MSPYHTRVLTITTTPENTQPLMTQAPLLREMHALAATEPNQRHNLSFVVVVAIPYDGYVVSTSIECHP